MVAKRVNHDGAILPGPSQALMSACAKAGYIAMASNLFLRYNTEYTDWDDLKPPYREIWEQVSKSIYAVIAIQGGAKVEEIPNVKNENEDEES